MQKDTVTMIIPVEVKLFDAAHKIRTFGPGICEVPSDFADHPHLKNNGAQKYDHKAEAQKAAKAAEIAKLEADLMVAEQAVVSAEKDADKKKAESEVKKIKAQLDDLRSQK